MGIICVKPHTFQRFCQFLCIAMKCKYCCWLALLNEIDDLATIQLSRDIASKIEEGMEYPGQIKVTVIREVRAEGLAK